KRFSPPVLVRSIPRTREEWYSPRGTGEQAFPLDLQDCLLARGTRHVTANHCGWGRGRPHRAADTTPASVQGLLPARPASAYRGADTAQIAPRNAQSYADD